MIDLERLRFEKRFEKEQRKMESAKREIQEFEKERVNLMQEISRLQSLLDHKSLSDVSS